MLGGDWRTGAAFVLRAAAGELDVDRLAGVAAGLQVAGDVERVVRESAGRHDEVAERDVALGSGGAEADGIERHARLAGGFDGGARFDAGVLSAVGHDDDAGERRVVIESQFIGERLAEPRFRAARLQGCGPVDGFVSLESESRAVATGFCLALDSRLRLLTSSASRRPAQHRVRSGRRSRRAICRRSDTSGLLARALMTAWIRVPPVSVAFSCSPRPMLWLTSTSTATCEL